MHARRRIAAAFIAIAALALPLVATVPASARPANFGTFFIQDDNGTFPGDQIVNPGHGGVVFVSTNTGGDVFTKISTGGSWYELSSGGLCFDAVTVSGSPQPIVYMESCNGSTVEQFTNNVSGRRIENRHYGQYLTDEDGQPNLDSVDLDNTGIAWLFPDAA